MGGMNPRVIDGNRPIVGEGVLDAGSEIRDARILERWVYVADAWAPRDAVAKATRADGKSRREQVREVGICRATAGRGTVLEVSARAEDSCLVGSTNRGEEDQRSLRIIVAPCTTDDGGMFCTSDVPGKANARADLSVVVGDTLWRSNLFAPADALADPHFSAGNCGLRLGILRSVPTKAVCDREPRGELPFILPVETDARLEIVLERVGFEDVDVVEAQALNEERRSWGERARRRRKTGAPGRAEDWLEIAEGIEFVFANAPAGEDVFAILEGVHIAAKLHVVLAEGIGEVVCNLELSRVIVTGEVKTLAERGARFVDEDLRSAVVNRMAFAGLAADFDAEFIHFGAKGGGESKDSADALIDEIFGCPNRVGSFGLSLAAGETVGVVAAAESAKAEMVGGAALIIVVAKQGEEILILIVRAVQVSERVDSVASGQ